MILLITIFFFLFTLYMLSADDFVFMRKNVSQIALFDLVILSGLVGLFFSRLTYASLHPSFAYFNPLVFFVIPYFPGLSLSGFLIGVSLSLYILGIRGKLPLGRVFDVMSLSLFPAAFILFGWEGIYEVLKKDIYLAVIYAVASLIFISSFVFFKKFLAKSLWKDGTLSFILLAIFSLLQVVISIAVGKLKTFPAEVPIFLFFVCVLFFSFLIGKLRRERI